MSVKVEAVALEGFFSHAKTLVKLPDKGIVLITGPNGAGKSSIMEGVSVALWGKTLRGTSPWPGDGRVRVMAAGQAPVAAERLHKGSRTTLLWGVEGSVTTQYETTTKAQEALEHVIGSWDVWRRSAVFSSQDAAHFTLATDKERKLLLESILGLDRFDSALGACRKDLAAVRIALDNAGVEEKGWATRLEERKRKLAELREIAERDTLPPKPEKPSPLDENGKRSELASLDGMIDAAEKDIRKLDGKREEGIRAAASAHARFEEFGDRAKQLDTDNCPTCGQSIPKDMRVALHRDFEAAGRAYSAATKTEQAEGHALSEQRSELVEELEVLRRKRNARSQAIAVERSRSQAAEREYANAMRTYTAAEKRIAEAEKLVERAASDVTEAAGQFMTARESREKVAQEHVLLLAVEQVLGLKGVRAHILGKALAGLEAVGNAWLSRICDGALLSLELKSYSEKVTGGVSDAISIEVNGAGNGYGYRAASGGERRRIDVALLLALAEVAQAANGAAQDSTLWFDEVFDALDSGGVEAVASALRDLARSRAVVVMTHSEALASRIDATVKLSVEAGHIEPRSTQASGVASVDGTRRGHRP